MQSSSDEFFIFNRETGSRRWVQGQSTRLYKNLNRSDGFCLLSNVWVTIFLTIAEPSRQKEKGLLLVSNPLYPCFLEVVAGVRFELTTFGL